VVVAIGGIIVGSIAVSAPFIEQDTTMISSHVLNQAGGRAVRSPAHFEKLLRGCLVGLGPTSSSLIRQAQVSVHEVLSDADMDLFFPIRRDRFGRPNVAVFADFKSSRLSHVHATAGGRGNGVADKRH
jgi:hypothetical protein